MRRRHYIAGTYSGPVEGLKVAKIGNNAYAVAVVGQATPADVLYNSKKARKPYSTGREYTAMPVRDYNKWISEQRDSIWYSTLQHDQSSGRYTLVTDPINLLRDSGLALSASAGFDISQSGVIFIARRISVPYGTSNQTNFCYIPSSSISVEQKSFKPSIFVVPGLEGASSSPAFSPSGASAVFLQKKTGIYEDDKNRVILVKQLQDDQSATELHQSSDGKGAWSLSPLKLLWSNDGNELYTTAEDSGRVRLFRITIMPSLSYTPHPLTSEGCIESVQISCSGVHSDRRLFVTKSSFIDDSTYSILDPHTEQNEIVSSNNSEGSTFGLHPSQVSEVSFAGAGPYSVQTWMIRPSSFDPNKTYPFIYVIHGGPSNSWTDGWRYGTWNLALFAEQGYVVVAPNITGSTGFGEEFTDASKNSWGGRAYEDLVKGFAYVKQELKYVDTNRAVAMGISYGGYLVNWIAGQALGKEFKALVTECGTFSTLNMYAQDASWFKAEFCGSLASPAAFPNYARWSPASHISNWTTPHLIIANELDYRVPITEGLAPFHLLQEQGVESRFLSFADEGHTVQKMGNKLHWWRSVLGWCNRFCFDSETEQEGRVRLGAAGCEPGGRT